MSLYSSTATIFTVGAASLLLLIAIIGRENPFRYLRTSLERLIRSGQWVWLGMALILVLGSNWVELQLEIRYADVITWDYTNAAAEIGTGFLLALQRLEWAPLTHLLTYVYVIIFPLLGIASALVYSRERDWESLRRLGLGLVINYAVALPFYLLFPVKEAWAGDAGIRFLIPSVFPGFETIYRPMSGLDNCFPSLHTSLALTYALVALQSSNRRLSAVIGTAAGLVMLSTLYLGVHWVPDMLGGVILAVAASGYLTGAVTAWVQRSSGSLLQGTVRHAPASRGR